MTAGASRDAGLGEAARLLWLWAAVVAEHAGDRTRALALYGCCADLSGDDPGVLRELYGGPGTAARPTPPAPVRGRPPRTAAWSGPHDTASAASRGVSTRSSLGLGRRGRLRASLNTAPACGAPEAETLRQRRIKGASGAELAARAHPPSLPASKGVLGGCYSASKTDVTERRHAVTRPVLPVRASRAASACSRLAVGPRGLRARRSCSQS